MQIYLFDTNIWSKWFREEPFVIDKIAQLDKTSKIFLSCVVLGEATYGAKINKNDFDFESYKEFIHLKAEPLILEIDKHVSEVYGELRAALFDKYLRKKKRPEQLIDPATATEIGIDENDLWIVSQAITKNLTLITNDKMHRIFSITPKELKYEMWK
jgi:predicted nucleic acid-binding protein